MLNFISFGAYRNRFRLFLLFYLPLLLVLVCTFSESKMEKKALPKTPITLSTWDSILTILYDDPTVFLQAPDTFKNNIETYELPDSLRGEYAWALVQMAYQLYIHEGDIQKAINYYEEAVEYTRQFDVLSDEEMATYIFKPLGNCYTIVGDFQKAERLVRHTLQTDIQRSTHASLLNNLAISYLYNGRLKEAILTAKSAKEQTPKHPRIPELGLSDNILSEAYYRLAETDSASFYNEEALAVFENLNTSYDTVVWQVSAFENKARLMLDKEDISSAFLYTEKALGMLEGNFPNSRNREKAKLYNLYAGLQSGEKALKSYQKATDLLLQNTEEKYFLDNTFSESLLGKARLFTRSNIDSAIYYYAYAIENDFRVQQLISSDESHYFGNTWNKSLISEAVRTIHSKGTLNSEDEKLALWLIELGKSRQLISEINRSRFWKTIENQDITDQLRHLQYLYRQKNHASPQSKEQWEQQISEALLNFELNESFFQNIFEPPSQEDFFHSLNQKEASFISYFEDSDFTYFGISYENEKARFFSIDEKDLKGFIRDFQSSYFGADPSLYTNNPEKYNLKAEYLKELLFPNQPMLHENIYISTDGAINGFPLDALMDKGRFLVEKHNMSYLNSFLLFELLQDRASSSDLSLLFKSDYHSPLPSLQFVKEEVSHIHRKYTSDLYDHKKQSIEDLNALFATSAPIHVAAHTTLEEGKDPILQLEDPVSTGELTYFSINSPFIFLAACNTAQGENLSSEGISSLNRSFLSKGVPSVISTYWSANDQIMVDLTLGFYKAVSETRSPMQALGMSKRDFLMHAPAHLRNPWYWGHINYHGVNNAVLLNKKSNSKLFILIAVVAFSFILFLWKKKG